MAWLQYSRRAVYFIVGIFGFALLFPGAVFQSGYGHLQLGPENCDYPLKITADVTNIKINIRPGLSSSFNDPAGFGDAEIVLFYTFFQQGHTFEKYNGLVSGQIYIDDWSVDLYDSWPNKGHKSLPEHPKFVHLFCGDFLELEDAENYLQGAFFVSEIDTVDFSWEKLGEELAEEVVKYGVQRVSTALGAGPVGTIYAIGSTIKDLSGVFLWLFVDNQNLGSVDFVVDLYDEDTWNTKHSVATIPPVDEKGDSVTAIKNWGNTVITFEVTVEEIPKECIPVEKKDDVKKTSAILDSNSMHDLLYENNISPNPSNLVYYDSIDNTNSEIQFTSIDGQVNIPDWIKQLAMFWANKNISDEEFIAAVEFLIKSKIITSDRLSVSDEEGTTGTQISPPGDVDIPLWVQNNAKWFAEGAIGAVDFARGLEFLVEEEIIKSPRIKVVKDTGTGSDQGFDPSQLDENMVTKLYETQKWNELAMRWLVAIKNSESILLEKASKDAWQEYSQDKNPESMEKATDLEEAKKQANQEALDAVQILGTTQNLVETARGYAKINNFFVLDFLSILDTLRLQISTTEQQELIDSVPSGLETEDQITGAYNELGKAQKNANNAMKDSLKAVLKNLFEEFPGLSDFTSYDQNQILDESLPNVKYQDVSVAKVTSHGDLIRESYKYQSFEDVMEAEGLALVLSGEFEDPEIDSVISELAPVFFVGPDESDEPEGDDPTGLINKEIPIGGSLEDILFSKNQFLGIKEALKDQEDSGEDSPLLELDYEPTSDTRSKVLGLSPVIVIDPDYTVAVYANSSDSLKISAALTSAKSHAYLSNFLHPDLVSGHVMISNTLENTVLGLVDDDFIIEGDAPPLIEPEPPIDFDYDTGDHTEDSEGSVPPPPIFESTEEKPQIIFLEERNWSQDSDTSATAHWRFIDDNGNLPSGSKVNILLDDSPVPESLIVDENGDIFFEVKKSGLSTLEIDSIENEDEAVYLGECDEIEIALSADCPWGTTTTEVDDKSNFESPWAKGKAFERLPPAGDVTFPVYEKEKTPIFVIEKSWVTQRHLDDTHFEPNEYTGTNDIWGSWRIVYADGSPASNIDVKVAVYDDIDYYVLYKSEILATNSDGFVETKQTGLKFADYKLVVSRATDDSPYTFIVHDGTEEQCYASFMEAQTQSHKLDVKSKSAIVEEECLYDRCSYDVSFQYQLEYHDGEPLKNARVGSQLYIGTSPGCTDFRFSSVEGMTDNFGMVTGNIGFLELAGCEIHSSLNLGCHDLFEECPVYYSDIEEELIIPLD